MLTGFLVEPKVNGDDSFNSAMSALLCLIIWLTELLEGLLVKLVYPLLTVIVEVDPAEITCAAVRIH